MKKIFSIVLIALFGLQSMAQLDRSVRPEPGPAPSLDFGKYKLYELDNGLKVIAVRNNKLPRVTMNLVIDRDPIYGGEKAGYESMTGSLLRQGTTNRPKAQLDEEIDFMGANLSTRSTGVFASGLSKYADKLMELLADVTLNPAFPQEEFDKLKKQTISGIESNKDDPSAIAGNIFGAKVYGKDHPYGEIQTVKSTESISVEDCKNYYNSYWMPNSAYLVIVGDIKPSKAKKLAKKYFGAWKRGEMPKNTYNAPTEPTGLEISMVNKESAVQSVIDLGNVIDLKPGAEDIVKVNVMNQILGAGSLGRLYLNIREDKGFTYGAYSSYDTDRLIGEFNAGASVRNDVTDSAIVEFMKEFQRIRTEPVTEAELQAAKNYINGSFGRSLERPQTIASFALNIERYGLPKDYYETYLTRLGNVTAEDVMAAANKYIKTNAMHITVVGKASEIADKLEAFGKVNYYDGEANPTSKPSMPVPEGITAQMVLDNYIKAKGGAENMNKVKDLKMTMDISIPGAPPLVGIELKKRPNYFMQELTIPSMGATAQKTVYDGKTGKISGMQGEQVLEGDDLENTKIEAMFDIELHYAEMGYTMELTKMAMVDGKKAFVMEVTSPKGDKSSHYFDEASGLKVKKESVEETPQGPISSSTTFSDYREVNGVMYPYSQKISAGPQKVSATITEIKVNSGLKKSDFK